LNNANADAQNAEALAKAARDAQAAAGKGAAPPKCVNCLLQKVAK
jgi:hypothetical protein